MEKRQGIFDTLCIQSENSSKALRVVSFLEKYYMKPGLNNTQEGRELAFQFEEYANTITTLIQTNPRTMTNKNLKTRLEKLSGFYDFLRQGEPDSNYRKLANYIQSQGYSKSELDEGLRLLSNEVELGLNGSVLGFEPQEQKRDEPQLIELEGTSTSAWIRDTVKSGQLYKTGPGGMGRVPDVDQLVRVMAARYAADSERGNREKLDSTPFVKEQVDKMASILKSDKSFQQFLGHLQDPNRPELLQEAVSAASAGHGGQLDDLFTKYLANKNPGELANTPLINRYMPTALQRIEALMEKAKDPTADHAAIAAEIVVLRNKVQAEKGKKSSLKVKIPADEQLSLQKDVNALKNDPEFRAFFEGNKTQFLEDLGKGHGGDLVQHMVEWAVDRERNKSELGMDAKRILKHNTRGGQMEELRNRAQEIKEKLENEKYLGKNERTILVNEAKQVAAAYMVHVSAFLDRKNAGRWVADETKTKQTQVPWAAFRKNLQAAQQEPITKGMIENMDYKSAHSLMRDIAYQSPQAFIAKQVEAQRKAALNPKPQGEQAQNEKQKNLEEPQKPVVS